MKLDVKETNECFDYADKVLDEMAAHKSDDGKISRFEVGQTIVSTAPAGLTAWEGSEKISAELKDLDVDEAKQLAGRAIDLVQKLLVVVTGKGRVQK